MLTLPIYDVTPFTLLDFPGQTACIIWFSGCNMRCGYCHNPQIVKGVGDKSVEDVLAFLEKRRDLLNGVVLSGGEATLYKDIIPFVTKIKCMGYAVKLDTNGTRPDIIQEMLLTTTSERQGRVIDHDSSGSMEKKKQEGYF